MEIEGINREYNLDIIKEHEPIVFKDNQITSNNHLGQSYLKDTLKWVQNDEGNFWSNGEDVEAVLQVVKQKLKLFAKSGKAELKKTIKLKQAKIEN